MKFKFIILFFGCLLSAAISGAQELSPVDSVVINNDSSTTLQNKPEQAGTSRRQDIFSDTAARKKTPFEPNPKKSGMYSSILPGLGQAYNRQYWKVPLVYAILGTAGYFIGYNYRQYADFRQAYIYAIDGDPGTTGKYPLYDASDLQRLQNNYKKDLDVIVLLTSVGYALQIMDAVASAHLRNFDVSRDISMQMKPVMQSNYIGFGLVVNFK